MHQIQPVCRVSRGLLAVSRKAFSPRLAASTQTRTFSRSTTALNAADGDGDSGKKKPYPPLPLPEEPIARAKRVIKEDWENTWDMMRFQKFGGFAEVENRIFPEFCDILIVGGGIMGSTVAYYLKERIPRALTIVVVEKDPTYQHAASTNSMGTIRVQFSDEHNVKCALFGAEFLRKMEENLRITLEENHVPKSVEFSPQGFLFLGTQSDVAQMEINHETQLKAGAKVALLTPDLLRTRYPWMNFEDIALGSYGLENEGWYDTWQLLYALKEKNMSFGIYYVHGEVVDFLKNEEMGDHHVAELGGHRFDRLKHAVVVTPDRGTKKIQFAFAIDAAGHESANVAKMAGIGGTKGLRILPLPVEKRKRYMFSFHCPDGPKLSFPVLVDPNGLFVRRNGLNGMYLCSWTPKTNEEEPDPRDPTGNEMFFQEIMWPKLAFRVPAFSQLQLRGAWATYYDYNYFDQAGVVGHHPYHFNFFFATGFSGYGLQMAPAVGRAIQDLMLERVFRPDMDFTKYKFERFVHYEPMKESVLV